MAADTLDMHASSPVPGALLQAEAQHVTRDYGTFTVHVATYDGAEHVVLVRGDVSGREHVLCRVSSACVMSTALGSAECDCSGQVTAAMDRIANDPDGGILIYLLNQEGRGHGLKWKVRALKNKNDGMDTFAAVEELGLEPDVRDYTMVPAILDELGVRSVTMLTNNPEKRMRLEDVGVRISQTQALEVCAPKHAWRHMEAKKARGHELSNGYMVHDDTTEIPVLSAWMPTMTSDRNGHSQDGASSALSQ